jgi:perosamine synthetase
MLKIEDFTAEAGSSIMQVLERIDANARGICFIVERGRLVGVATDGDIRRGLLRGIPVDGPVDEVMNRDFEWLPVGSPEKEIQDRFSEKVKIIPLCDPDGVVVDFADLFRNHRIPVLEPRLGSLEMEYVQECIRTNWISSQGKFVTRFEEQFAEMHEGTKSLAVSNGTVALHLALKALEIGAGDEVIIPDLTFAATANAVIHAGATPVFCDVDPETWVMTPDNVEALIGDRTRAIMPVHLYGQPCDMPAIMDLARRNGLLVIEDAAEALGSRWRDRLVGTFGDAATFSFFGNKTITTGEGGMVLLRNEAAYERAAILRDHGMRPGKRYWHDVVGYNYRMTNLQAAVGSAQMERFDTILEKKLKIAASYDEHLRSAPFVQRLPIVPEGAIHSNWLYTILFQPDVSRDEVARKLLLNGIDTRPVFFPMHEMPPYARYECGPIVHSVEISRSGLSLPSSVTISDEEIDYVSVALDRTAVSAVTIA